MGNGPEDETGVPQFEDVFPDLDVAGQLLAALAAGDDSKVDELRGSADADWWNVALTLGLLLRDVHQGSPAAVGLVQSLIGESSPSDS